MNSYLNNKILEVNNVSKSFGTKTVLKNVSINLAEGEIVGLLGVSGSGKSTLFNIISGTLKPDSGEVFLKGVDITGEVGKISYMLQKDLLLPHMTIVENVSLPLVLKGVNKTEAVKSAQKYFHIFGIDGTERKYPYSLSGGMRQRAALLRTYMNKNEVILLDEPFSALDMITKGKMHNWFLEIIRSINLSALFVTHDVDEAIYLSNRVYVLSPDGEITDEIVIDEVYPREESFKLSERFLMYKKQIISIL